VGAYTLPPWQFDKILYIEKEGLEAQLAPYRLGQQYDMAIIFGKGEPVTACRNLLARSEIRDMKLFVLHDADIGGYSIARTLAEATPRMPNHSVDIIDLGLTVPQVIELGLETEKFTRRKELPVDLELDEDALEWFTGEPIPVGYGKYHYECRRCELNAFSSDELAEFIEARDEALTDLVARELERLVDIDRVVRQLVADYPDLADVDEARIGDTFTDNPTQSWRSSAEQLVAEDIDAVDGITDAVRALLVKQLAASMNDDGDETDERP